MSDPDLSRVDEAILVCRARSGDDQAFRRLVEAYERRVLYFILRFVPDTDAALDILQEAWIAVFRLLPKLKSHEAFRVWLYKIARGKAVEHLRRRNPGGARRENLETVDVGTADDTPLSIDNAELVHFALNRVGDAHREVLTLYFLEDMPLHEIAEVLECPLGTAKSRMYYAKQAFRAVIREQTDG